MISGDLFKNAVISAANNMYNQKNYVDELNVFPVPDGDTGTNMSMTLNACVKQLETLDNNPSCSCVADIVASSLLRGARGNSGVILSLLFKGFSKSFKDKTSITGVDIANALSMGVEGAYKAVMNPTEGTILTVARETSEQVQDIARQTNDFNLIFEEIVKLSKESLDKTPEILEVLKKAGVVDAGGAGFVIIFEGMLKALQGNPVLKITDEVKKEVVFQETIADYDQEITFTYCTEFIIEKTDINKNSLALRAYLETIGDSVVVVDDDDIIKIHVHTNNPGNAMQEGLKFGQLINIKIENMRKQYKEKIHQTKQLADSPNYVKINTDIPYGFVAVSAGVGINNIFSDLGVDTIVTGGQTMNPSTDDILRAIESVGAETVFVLPNNKNIIMSAEQAIKLADRRVCVLQTRNIPQGIAAMMNFDPDASFNDNRLNMTKAIDNVQTGQITFAARDSDFDGHKIKSGEILALNNGKLDFTEKDLTKALLKLVKHLIKKDSTFLTIIYGSDVSDYQADLALQAIHNKFGDNIEINLVSGGQPIYYYILSVE